MQDKIIIKGASMHNLQNINLEIPHNALVVISGVSGSGKSSLAFDTIFAEGQRQYIESLSPYMRQFLGQRKMAKVEEIIGLAPAISINQKALSHNPRSTVGTLTEINDYLRILFAKQGNVFCPLCSGPIEKLSIDEIYEAIAQKFKQLKLKEFSILSPIIRAQKGEHYQVLYKFLSLGYEKIRVNGSFHRLKEKLVLNINKKHNIELLIDTLDLSDKSRVYEAIELALQHGNGLLTMHSQAGDFLFSSNWICPRDNFVFPELEARLFSFNSPQGACQTCFGLGRLNIYSDKLCPACKGQRLRKESLSVSLAGLNIAEISSLSVDKLYAFFWQYYQKMTERDKKIAENLILQILDRLEFLERVGLSYLSLDREASSLSGGEAQRIRLSSQIGSQLSRTLYVLDEPSIGLHERDTDRLIQTLKTLRDKRNTVIIVEHDERTILASDYLIDLGPGAGIYGGKLMASGETKNLISSTKFKDSLTLQYLRGEKKIALPDKRRKQNHYKLKIRGARANNLKNLNLDLPLGRLVGLSGVSGSGKSSLLYNILYKNLSYLKSRKGSLQKPLEQVDRILGSEYVNKVVLIDQSPIARNSRSNPASYSGVLGPIRDFYAELPESRARAYSKSRFSFNRSGGRCESCAGAGSKLIEMHFLPPVLVDCEVCQGARFNQETLAVRYKGKNISDVLNLSISEALKFFAGNYHITDKLEVLDSVGLSYLKLGQSATTLSGGEAQRLKIAKELSQVFAKRSLYLLDEPSTGLHYQDIELLLAVLNKLVDRGNSVLVIEHNLHILKSMDYIIDLGPEAGEQGGRLVAQGSPEEIADNEKSITGKYLKELLKN